MIDIPRKTLALIIGLIVVTIILFVVALSAGKASASEELICTPTPIVTQEVVPTSVQPTQTPGPTTTPTAGPTPTSAASSDSAVQVPARAPDTGLGGGR